MVENHGMNTPENNTCEHTHLYQCLQIHSRARYEDKLMSRVRTNRSEVTLADQPGGQITCFDSLWLARLLEFFLLLLPPAFACTPPDIKAKWLRAMTAVPMPDTASFQTNAGAIIAAIRVHSRRFAVLKPVLVHTRHCEQNHSNA